LTYIVPHCANIGRLHQSHRNDGGSSAEHLGLRPVWRAAGHADLWQVCLAPQLRDCQYAIEAGNTIFAPRMKALLLRAVVLARWRKQLAESTRRTYQARLDRELDAIMVLAPTNSHGRRLRKRYGKVRSHLFTFLEHPEVPPDNNGSERELRPTATYCKVTGGFRST
jgi:transposase